jgi:hypothetical protein
MLDLIPVPKFSHADLEDLADAALGLESSRLAGGINIHDQPARALSKAYLKAKTKKGGNPIRDLHLTGDMMRARGITNVGDRAVTIGFSDGLQYAKAAHNEKIEPMLGPSADDKRHIDEDAQELLDAHVRILNGE